MATSKAQRCIEAVMASLTDEERQIAENTYQQHPSGRIAVESVADFKQRIAIIRRRIETGREYSVIGASRIPEWCADARGKRVGSGQRRLKQNDSRGILESPKTAKPTKKDKNL